MNKSRNFTNGYELFEYIFENEILKCDCYYYYQSHEETITWKDCQIENIAKSKEEFSDTIIDLIENVIEKKNQGGDLTFTSCKKDGELGFIVNSNYSSSMLDELDHEGRIDSMKFINKSILKKLNTFPSLKKITKENLTEFLEFSISTSEIEYFNIYDYQKKEWVDGFATEYGAEVLSLFEEIFAKKINGKYSHGGISHGEIFTESYVSFFSREQLVIEENAFLSIRELVDFQEMKKELYNIDIDK